MADALQGSRKPWRIILISKKQRFFLAPKGATIITMNETLSVEDIQKQLDELNGYTISKINQ